MLNQFDSAHRHLLDGIQGNILKAHGRHHTANLFLRCLDTQQEAAKTWLNKLVDGEDRIVRPAYAQLRSNALWKESRVDSGLFACVYISAAGYDYLFPGDDRIRQFEAVFLEGMKARKDALADPDQVSWEPGFRADSHLMLLLAHADPQALAQVVGLVLEQTALFANVATIEYGAALLNAEGAGIEHFGYVDGISQPLFFEDELTQYQAENNLKPGQPMAFDPSASPGLVLTADPFGSPDALGSYFVFRKLEQNVKAFKEREKELGEALWPNGTDEERERAGALIVGRFEDGTPAQLSEKEGLINSARWNNFDYMNPDGLVADGSRCPFHAHIRKSNPRSGLLDKGKPFASTAAAMTAAKGHIMARRGITYGTRADDPNDGLIRNKPEGGVGLLFMSYQASIARQFEVIQRDWVNSPAFPGHNPDSPGPAIGNDPVIGQGVASDGSFAKRYGDAATMTSATFAQCVTLKGGAYFFAPSMSFLQNIHSL